MRIMKKLAAVLTNVATETTDKNGKAICSTGRDRIVRKNTKHLDCSMDDIMGFVDADIIEKLNLAVRLKKESIEWIWSILLMFLMRSQCV